MKQAPRSLQQRLIFGAEGHIGKTRCAQQSLPRAPVLIQFIEVDALIPQEIASGQARRLAAEGLFVDLKPDIADWMLAPGGDVRSANMLETVQNQYQVQGLELDYTLVCWDGDLRRGPGGWSAWKMSGSGWQRDKGLNIAKNGYRVLLTRARKGMVVFVPIGDVSGEDTTRSTSMYDEIANYLISCGARTLVVD